ncbi:amidase domain-containing protein [Ornithinibacillus bavariensis]|uniref:Putative amidase domain-containing protein n=1 Tax=Ornithinibacillus bavariensis TaxID=545502 RepID=A0A919X5N4_9BACI|nr:amidase domain-containing protein [Ornithinibacillus bavariensis]GIO26376.1 hypothetical protein J43TS3_09870 [Ornithinibacillus bavariensis]
MKKYTIFISFFSLILFFGFMSNDVMAEKKARNDYTFGEIEQMLVKYLDNNGYHLEIGTPEFTDFVNKQMLYDADQKLANLSEYHLFVAYFAEYLHRLTLFETELMSEYDSFTYSTDLSNTDKTILEISGEKFSMSNLKDITLGEMEEEILQEENELAKLQEIKQLNPELMAVNTINITKARAYATKFYNSFNGLYPKYSADCTNFVSQILEAGGKKQVSPGTVTTLVYDTKYWFVQKRYSDAVWTRSTSWTVVEDLYKHLYRNHATYTSTSKKNIVAQAKTGDVIQFKKPGAQRFSHSMWVYTKYDGDIALSGHSDPALTKRLTYITSFTTFRIIKM